MCFQANTPQVITGQLFLTISSPTTQKIMIYSINISSIFRNFNDLFTTHNTHLHIENVIIKELTTA